VVLSSLEEKHTMLRLLVYKFKDRYYIFPLGCCGEYQTKEDVFLVGGEEEVFTVTHNPGASTLETLRQLMTEIDKRGIVEVEGLTIILDNHQARAVTAEGSHRTVH